MSTLRVILVDDHALFRDGLASLVTAWDMEVVGQASDGEQALELVERLQPDLILMDIHMPNMDGLQATRIIKEHYPKVKIVILTVSEKDEHLFDAIKSGAEGFLPKNLSADQVGDLLLRVSRGEAALTSNLATKIMMEFARQSQPEASSNDTVNDPDELTEREIEVLRLLAQGDSNRSIADLLSVSENTIKFHVRNILSKLHVRSRTEAATLAIRKGLTDA